MLMHHMERSGRVSPPNREGYGRVMGGLREGWVITNSLSRIINLRLWEGREGFAHVFPHTRARAPARARIIENIEKPSLPSHRNSWIKGKALWHCDLGHGRVLEIDV